MVERHAPRVHEYHERKLAAQEGQDKGVGHGAYHVAPYVHAGAEELPAPQRRIGCVDLLQGGRDAHGNVHYGAQSAYQNARHQNASYAHYCSRLPQLKERLRGFQPVAVYLCYRLHRKAEQHRQQCSGHGAHVGAYGLSVHSAEYGKTDQRNVRADYEGRDYGWRAFYQQRY